jgi:S1-C subfamily serine protease
MFKKMLSGCMVLCLAAGTLWAQSTDAPVGVARKTLQSYDKAIITLAAVIKIEAKGGEISGANQEHKTQCVAAIIDPSGLVLTSLTNLAPKIRINRGGGQVIELECQVQEVKYRLTDGTEVPARVVLKDDDLDLAFLAPLKPLDKATEAKIAVLPMSDAVAQPEMLESTIVIGRTGEDLNYIPTLTLGRIVSLVSTPRTCYISSSGGLGVPVFNHEGKVLGIICRCVKAEGADATSTARSAGLLSQLILPVADIMRLVPQAKEEAKKPVEGEKKPEEKKPEEKKPAGQEKKDIKPEKKPANPEKKPTNAEKPGPRTVN